MFKPEVMVMDYETNLLDGSPSLDFYRPDFRATSAAFAWRGKDGQIKTKFLRGEVVIGQFLRQVLDSGIPIVVHNFQFEYGVTKHRFPGLEGTVAIDTMRLTQVADNGGREAHWQVATPLTYEQQLDALDDEDKYEEWERKQGLGLVSATSRWLPAEYQNHKEPYYALIRERCGCKKGDEGKSLHYLTDKELEDYNVADAVVTLVLYETLTAEFNRRKYNWRLDHSLYVGSAIDIANAKGAGVPVNRLALEEYQRDLGIEVKEIEDVFRSHFPKEIKELEDEAQGRWINALKTEKGRQRRREELASGKTIIEFNVGSNKQLATLFVNKLGMTPKFYTQESKKSKAKRAKNPNAKPFIPSPSFKAAHLHTWGSGGELLYTRRKRLLVLSQVKSLLELSAHDGKWHLDLKACGTTTGRFAGGRV